MNIDNKNRELLPITKKERTMKKPSLIYHPLPYIIFSAYFLLTIPNQIIANPEYLNFYLFASFFALPGVLLQKLVLHKNIDAYVLLANKSVKSFKDLGDKVSAEQLKLMNYTLWIVPIEVLLHYLLRLPILWVGCAFMILLIPEMNKIYKKAKESLKD